jgi:hypothetical protein
MSSPALSNDEHARGRPKWLHLGLCLATWCGLALSSYSLYLHFAEPLRVYPHIPETATDWLVAALSLALFCPLAYWTRRKAWWLVLPVAALAGYLVLYLPASKRDRYRVYVESCGNHSGWWGAMGIADLVNAEFERDPLACLPNGTTIDKLISAMIEGGHLPHYTELPIEEEEGQRWTWYCPGRDRSTEPATGYVYVGGGLPIKRAMEKEALIALDAAGCHPPPEDHEHAFVCTQVPTARRCRNTAQMLHLIENALRQAETGEVPYSKEAVLLLKRELDARKRLLKRGTPVRAW